VAQGEGPDFKPQYRSKHQKTKKQNPSLVDVFVFWGFFPFTGA
jgi:hypothetical protein